MRELGVRTEIASIQTAPLPADMERTRPQYVLSDGHVIEDIVHGKSEITVDKVLESLADAVLAIVMFQIEADENVSHLISAQFDGLVQACTFFADLAEKKAILWEETEEADNKETMLGHSKKLKDIMFEMAKQLKKLQANKYDQEAKESLLFACREVMETGVALLECSDRYDIRKILRLCKGAKAQARRMNEPPAITEFEAAVGAFIQETVLLAKYVAQRIEYLSDPAMETRLENANADVRTLPEQLIHASLAVITQPQNPTVLSTKERLYLALFKAICEIEEATIESQQRMFAGVLLDLEPINRDNLVQTEPTDPNSVESVLAHFEGLLRQAQDALMEGASTKGGKLCREAGKWLDHLDGMAKLKMGAMAEGPQKEFMGEALSRLRNCLNNMVAAADRLKLDPGNAELLSQLALLFDPTVAAEFLEAWKAPGLSELFGQNVLAAIAHLNQLRDAVLESNQPKAVLSAKTSVAVLQQQLADAERALVNMTDPAQKVNLQDAIDRVKGMLADLLRATKSALEDPTNPTKRDALLAEIERAKLLAGELALLTNPPKKPGLFDDSALFNAAQKVHDALENLTKVLASGDYRQLPQALKLLTEALGEQSGLARNVAASTKYPTQQAKIQEIFAKVQHSLGALVQNTKELATRPGDKHLLDVMNQCIADGHKLADDLRVASSPFNDQMLGSLAALQAALDALARAAALASQGDPEGAARYHRELQNCVEHVADQIKLASDHARLFPSLKPAVTEAATFHNVTLRQLAADPAAPRDAQRITAVHAPALKESATKLIDALFSGEENSLRDAFFFQSHRLGELCDQLTRAVNAPHDVSGLASSTNQAQQALQEELELLALAQRRNPTQRSRLVDLAAQLAGHLGNLVPTVGSAHLPLSSFPLFMSSVRSAAFEATELLVNPEELAGMIELEALRLVRASNPLITGAITAQSRDNIIGALQSLENLKAMSETAAKQMDDPKARRALQTTISGIAPLQTAIRSAADVIFRGQPNSAQAQSELRGALRDARPLSDRLVEQVYNGDVAKRLRDNDQALQQDLSRLQKHLTASEQPEAKLLLPLVEARLERQKDLANYAASHCTNPAAREPLLASIDGVAALTTAFKAMASPAVETLDPAIVQGTVHAINTSLAPQARRLTEAAIAALQAPPAAPQQVEITSLSTAAQHMQIATEHLVFDDTPKGRLNRAAWNIAQGMRQLAEAAEADDKKRMIEAARLVASYTATLVQDATAVSQISRDPRVANQLISMARAGKNWSVQLKILCAVKASSSGRDPTAESQLLTCATGLARSVVQCVQEADVAELKHK